MSGKWLKAKGSKYKHFYAEGRAICESKAEAYSELAWHEHTALSPKCPKCLRLKRLKEVRE